MATIGSGFLHQYRFSTARFDGRNDECGKWKQESAPRMRNLRNVLEAYGMFGKWIYKCHAEAILSRHKATSVRSCFDIAYTERISRGKTGVVRRMLEVLGVAPDPTLGVIRVGGSPRTSDSRELMLELDLGLGAYGGFREVYPVPGFSHHWALVRVTDEGALRSFCSSLRNGRARTGSRYVYDAYLYTDKEVGTSEFSTSAAEALIAAPPKLVEPAPGSNFTKVPWHSRNQELLKVHGPQETVGDAARISELARSLFGKI